MASERQMLANRRNAQKSTGPKTASGKKRSSQNAYKHGLSLPTRNVGSQEQLEELLHVLAGHTLDPEILELAGKAAGAEADLMRVREVKTAMLEQALMQTDGAHHAQPELLDPSRPLGDEEEDALFVNAIRHILPELTRIDRYERRAASRRNRAIHELVSMKAGSRK